MEIIQYGRPCLISKAFQSSLAGPLHESTHVWTRPIVHSTRYRPSGTEVRRPKCHYSFVWLRYARLSSVHQSPAHAAAGKRACHVAECSMVTPLQLLRNYQSLTTWMTSSTRVRGPCTLSASCVRSSHGMCVSLLQQLGFYSASACYAERCTIAIVNPSVWLSLCLSVTRWRCIKITHATLRGLHWRTAPRL